MTIDPEGQRELLEVINEESDKLNGFVEGLVELARIEAGDLQLRRRWGAVDEIVAAALERAKKVARRHKIVTMIEGELPVVQVDSRAVSEVVYTLIENAAKYAPPNTRILITAKRATGETIEIAVEDQGRGIRPEFRERVFDKFFRITDQMGGADAGQPIGMGMGLAIARGIVEAHGGRIWVEDSEEEVIKGGRGARIAFTVPVGDEEQVEN